MLKDYRFNPERVEKFLNEFCIAHDCNDCLVSEFCDRSYSGASDAMLDYLSTETRLRYTVPINYVGSTTITVEAYSESEAIEKAKNIAHWHGYEGLTMSEGYVEYEAID